MTRGSRARPWQVVAVAALIAPLTAAPSAAIFHEMLIVKVFVGSAAAPDAQYVVLQMYNDGQTSLGGHPMRFFNAGGTSLGTSSFGPISNGADDANILIATPTAEALFGITADLRVPVRMPAAGGKVCFDNVDCFAWEAYTNLPDSSIGTPFADFGDDLEADRLYAGALDAFDDTNNSDVDFQSESAPNPRNNAGHIGFRNVDAVFLDGFEDGNFTGWDEVTGVED